MKYFFTGSTDLETKIKQLETAAQLLRDDLRRAHTSTYELQVQVDRLHAEKAFHKQITSILDAWDRVRKTGVKEFTYEGAVFKK